MKRKKEKLNIIGNIYYTYDYETESFTMYRVIKQLDYTKFLCMIDNDRNNTIELEHEDLKKNYELLLSHAIITISDVIVDSMETKQDLHDVVLAVYKRESKYCEFSVPDIICRQLITDVFMQAYLKELNNNYVGVSVTGSTIPEGYTMELFLTCKSIISSRMVHIYRTDNIDDILFLLGDMKEFNDILRFSYSEKLKSMNKELSPLMLDKPIDGYCSNIKDLLISNNFMIDVNSMFAINHVMIDIDYDESLIDSNTVQSLTREQMNDLEIIYNQIIVDSVVIKYDFTVDLEEIKSKYILVKDRVGDLYIVLITTSEEELILNMIDPITGESKRKARSIQEILGINVKY